jgi:hypothetical protein
MKITASQTRLLVLTENQYQLLLQAVELARASYEGIDEWKQEERTFARLGEQIEGQ